MTIRLTKDLEKIVRDAMGSGRYKRKEDVIRDALTRLKQTLPEEKEEPEPRPVDDGPLSHDELIQRLLAAGLMVRPPDRSQDIDDDDEPPIEIEGEPLSATIIRERR
jgi:Arc/MetJ-type ribon-helix-helix transcriptional regulator